MLGAEVTRTWHENDAFLTLTLEVFQGAEVEPFDQCQWKGLRWHVPQRSRDMSESEQFKVLH